MANEDLEPMAVNFLSLIKLRHGWTENTCFGEVISGQEVVDSIQQNDQIEEVVIIRKGKEAKQFDAPDVFVTISIKKKLLLKNEKQNSTPLKKQMFQNLMR